MYSLIRLKGLEKNPQLINVGPTSIPEARVLFFCFLIQLNVMEEKYYRDIGQNKEQERKPLPSRQGIDHIKFAIIWFTKLYLCSFSKHNANKLYFYFQVRNFQPHTHFKKEEIMISKKKLTFQTSLQHLIPLMLHAREGGK